MAELTSDSDIRETVRDKYAALHARPAMRAPECCEAGFDATDTGERTFGVACTARRRPAAPAGR
jgi:hypothetical protein